MLTDTQDAYACVRAERAENEAAMDGIFAKMFPSRTIVQRTHMAFHNTYVVFTGI